MDEELKKNLEILKFKPYGYLGGMRGQMEDVIFTANEHPLKGFWLVGDFSNSREVGQVEGFLHKNATVAEIAQLMINLYERLKGMKETKFESKDSKDSFSNQVMLFPNKKESKENSKKEKYRRDNDYFTYKTSEYKCSHCGWKGMGEELEQGDMYDYGVEIHCPECSERFPGLIVFPTTKELMERGTEDDKIVANYSNSFMEKWENSKLRDISQLPDLYDENIAFILKEVEEKKESYIIITHETKVIWKEIRSYEYYWRFVEIGKIFKQKYGDKMVDLVPDVDGLYLYGDRLTSIKTIENFRKELREI